MTWAPFKEKEWKQLLFLGSPVDWEQVCLQQLHQTVPVQSLTKVITHVHSHAPHSSLLQLSYPTFLPFLLTHTHTHMLFPCFLCPIYLFFLSPWPSFLSTLWSFSQRPARADRKCGLRWVWAHQCSVYCPNLWELTLKTKSRASELVEFAGEGEEAK